MNIRTKTKRRVTILLTVTVTLIVAVVSFYLYRSAQIKAEMAEHREQGVTAAKAGEFGVALPHLSRYVTQEQEDVEALYYYSLARRRVEDARNRHIDEPISGFRQVLRLDPDHVAARKELLELYVIKGYAVEAMELAQQMLPKNPEHYRPDDVSAMLAMAKSYQVQNKLSEAIDWGNRVLAVEPTNLEAHGVILESRKRQGDGPPQLLALLSTWIEANPKAPQTEILRAMAALLPSAGNLQEHRALQVQAREALLRAAQHENPSDLFLQSLIAHLDRGSWFGESIDVLSRHAMKARANWPRRLLARRLLERGDYQRILDEFKAVAPDDAMANSEVLAIKVEAMLVTGRAAAVESVAPYLKELRRRGDDPQARSWTLYLTQLLIPEIEKAEAGDAADAPGQLLATAQKRMDVLSQALTADPNNPFMRYRLGETYAVLGETELAIAEWQRVTQLTSSWSTPLSRMARLMLAAGRPMQAIDASLGALVRNLRDGHAHLCYIEALSAIGRRGLTEQIAPRLEAMNLSADPLVYIEEFQKQNPGEPNTLAMFIDLLAAAGRRDEALAALEQALPREDLPQQTMLALALVAHNRELGHTDEILDKVEKAHGLTVELASVRAGLLAESGNDAAAGLRYMERMLQQHGADNLEWQIAYARQLDRAGDPRALDYWRKLGQQYDKNLAVQRLMLNSRVVQRERPLMQQTMQRMRALTGENALGWQLARARWLLTPETGRTAVADSAAREAVDLLNTIITASPQLGEARELLAVAHLVLGNAPAAIDQYAAALAQQPHRNDLRLRLARLHFDRGSGDQALALLDEAAAGAPLAAEKRDIAVMYASLGNPAKAITLLESLGQPDVMLAELYYRTYGGDPAKLERAAQMYATLMNKPTAPVIASYAMFRASQGDRQSALDALNRLDETKAEPGERHRLLAEFNRRFPDPGHAADSIQLATEQFKRASEEAPENRQVWASRIEHLLSINSVDDAFAVNREALKHHANDELFTALTANEPAIRTGLRDALAAPLVGSVITDAQHRRAALDALNLVHQAVTSNNDPNSTQRLTNGEVVARLRTIADANPRFFTLNKYLADMYAALNRGSDALTIAQRTSELLPNIASAQHLLVSALLLPRPDDTPASVAGRREDALLAARRTMQRFPTDAVAAERAARILASQGQWPQAITTAEEWRRRVGPATAEVDLFLTEAHLSAGQPDEALRRLEPYLKTPSAEQGPPLVAVALQARALIQKAGRDAAQREQLYQQAENLLKPRLAESAQARLFWMSYADRQISGEHADHTRAAAWLKRVEPVIPADSAEEYLTLSAAWRNMAARVADQGADQAATFRGESIRLSAAAADLAEKRYLAAQSAPDEAARSAAASAAARLITEHAVALAILGQDQQAAEQYRRVLKIDPGQAPAANNLAMLLAESARTPGRPAAEAKQMLDEALKLAQDAAAIGKAAAYLDTVAFVHSARGEYDKAIAALTRATELDGYNPEWWLNLAKAYLDRAEQLAHNAGTSGGGSGSGGEVAMQAVRGFSDALSELESRRLPLSERLMTTQTNLLERSSKLRSELEPKPKNAA